MRPGIVLIGFGLFAGGIAVGKSYSETSNSDPAGFEKGIHYMHVKYEQDFGKGLEIRACVERELKKINFPFDHILYVGSAKTDLKVPKSNDPKDTVDPNEYIRSSQNIPGSGFYTVSDDKNRSELIVQVQPAGLFHNGVTIIGHEDYSFSVFSQDSAMIAKRTFASCAEELMDKLPLPPTTIPARILISE